MQIHNTDLAGNISSGQVADRVHIRPSFKFENKNIPVNKEWGKFAAKMSMSIGREKELAKNEI